MKNKISFFALCALCVSAVFTISTAVAQVPTVYHPGDKLSFKVTFEGKDVPKLTGAQVQFNLITQIQPEQQGFGTGLNIYESKQVEPGVFEVWTVIPENTATGTFKLLQISTGTRDVGFQYRNGLPAITVAIDNHDHIARPNFKGIVETSKP